MSPTHQEVQARPEQARKRRRTTAATRARRPGVVELDEERREYTMVVRSPGAAHRCKSMTLVLSEPDEGEECSIALEPISEYSLPFMETGKQHRVSEAFPGLTKATLPCRHGFNALAVLYHFAKNSMTCPCCRAGHDKVRMAEQSVPSHLRRPFMRHLLQALHEEGRQQIAADAALAASVMELEVRQRQRVFPSTRIAVSLLAYGSMDHSSAPILALELPLSSSLMGGTLWFESSGYHLHQLNLNLLALPIRPRAFEVVVGVLGFVTESAPLFRTVRFPAEGAGRRLVFSNSVSPGPHSVHVETYLRSDQQQLFSRLYWAVTIQDFTAALITVAQADAVGLVALV